MYGSIMHYLSAYPRVTRIHAACGPPEIHDRRLFHGMQKKLALAAAVIHGPRILFLDEPFEAWMRGGGALKAFVSRMTARGVTIFLTSHVLEIVERLCSHVGIIHQGRLVAQGSIEELRAGVAGEKAARQRWSRFSVHRWPEWRGTSADRRALVADIAQPIGS